MEFRVQTESGGFDLHAAVRRIGEDILVAIWGGEKPHIGAVAMAEPRPSLRDPNVTSATTSVHCFIGHKEDALARAAATEIAAKMNARTVVTAGIHWDQLDAAGIRAVELNSVTLTVMVVQRLSSRAPSR